jgi:hypothetical protein
MGWCSATEIMDAAVEAAERAVAAAWQLASGNEDARTPAYANALQADPSIREKVDEVLRPFVARIAEQLRDGDWDCIEESNYFERFRREMLGFDHRQMADWYRERLTEDYDPSPEQVREFADLMAHHLQESTSGR